MNKEDKQKIKELKKDGKYEEIFLNYGSKIYKKNIPNKYKQNELKKLAKEGKYEAIYNKYGESIYNTYLIKAQYDEIKEVKGNFRATIWKTSAQIRNTLARMGIQLAIIAPSTLMIGAPIMTQSSIQENSVKYEKEIEAYEDKISKYADEIKELNLDDTQTIMKVVEDMWENIQGYATPSKDIVGYLELDLATQDGYGVCRNMASDVARKLNKINPEYNARTMNVKMESGRYEFADIERKIVETNETVVEENTSENEKEQSKSIMEEIIGNHMITLVDIPDKDIILVVDPTNPGLGIYKDGNITMFNSDKVDGLELETKEMSSYLLNGFKGVKILQDYISSFKSIKMSEEELREQYGIEAQNEALNTIEKMEEEQSFKQALKIKIEDSKNNTKTSKSGIEKSEMER